MDCSIVGDLFLGSFDRIAILLQAFTEGSNFFAWVRPNCVEVARVEGVLCLGVRIVELVAQCHGVGSHATLTSPDHRSGGKTEKRGKVLEQRDAGRRGKGTKGCAGM